MVEASFDKLRWDEIAKGNLSFGGSTACPHLTELVEVTPTGGEVAGRFIKFTVLSFHGGASGGLSYFSAVSKPKGETGVYSTSPNLNEISSI